MNSRLDDQRAARLERAIRVKQAAARSGGAGLPARPVQAAPRLSEMQRSLWLTHQLEPDSAAYNLVSAFRLSGSLDLSRLEQSFNTVLARHRILRSTFEAHREGILQIIHPHHGLPIEGLVVEDGEVLPAALRVSRETFDLTAGPLVRMVHIADRSEREALVLLVLHHILADEKSLEVVWQQLAEAYTGEDSGAVAEVQFDDYVYWLAQQSDTHRERDLEYWRRQLDPLPDELILPFESRPAEPSGPRGRLLTTGIPSALSKSLRALAAATGSTPFMVFAFAFRLLLERYTQGQDISFATPATTRSHPAAVDMIGYFLNPIVVRLAIDEKVPVDRSVREFSQSFKELLAHASVPFDVLAEDLAPPRRVDRHPIFQVMFVHQQRGASLSLGDAQLEPVVLDLGESKFDLTLFVTEGAGSLELAVEYRTDRFDEVWMQALLDHYKTLLAGLVEDRERAVSEVQMLTPRETGDLDTWQGTASSPGEGALLPLQVRQQCRRSPRATALACGGIRWSYGDLEQSALRATRALETTGVASGDRVGLFSDRSPWMIAGLLASHWADAAYIPLDPGYPAARNLEVLENADVAAVLTTSTLRDRLPEGAWETICIDELDAAVPSDIEIPEPRPEATAYILYTSGSTGRPKGVVVSHDNLRASTEARRRVYDSPPQRFLLLPSVAFDSSVAGIFWTLSSGGALVIPTDEEIMDPRRLTQIVARDQVDCLLCVPSLYAALLRADSGQLAGLETAIVAGESCSPGLVGEHFRLLPHVRLFNEYGPTEATVWATVHEVCPEDAGRPVAIGRPIPGTQVLVLDGWGRRVPAGIPGQAWIAGPTVAQGYWRNQELSDERFVAARKTAGVQAAVFRTGDLVSWTPDGRLLFEGRQDDQIKLRGFRIEPGEIEAVLLERPEIEEAAVVARPLGSGAEGPKHLVAFLRTSAEDAGVACEGILAKRLPDFMVPRRYVEIAEMPRLPNGKTDRRRLRRMALEPEPKRDRELLPATEREQSLAALWEGLLGRSDIGATDNFFELGGHSLLVVEMTIAIERDQGSRLTAAEVFQNPTVRQLARFLEKQDGARSKSYAHLFPIQPGGRSIPFIVAIPHVFTEMLAARFRGERPVYGLRGVGLRPEGNRGRWPTMKDLAEELVEEIDRRFPGETCVLAGYSFGASMAFEATRLMEERGMSVDRLYLIAPMPLNFYRWGPLSLEIDGLCKPVEELTFSEAWGLLASERSPLARRVYSRAWRLLAVQPWRHVLCAVGRLRKLLGLPLTPRILHADVRIERFRLHRRFRPGIVRTPTVVFNPKETDADIASTWRPHFQGPFTVCETPDPHLGETAIERAKELILEQLEELKEA